MTRKEKLERIKALANELNALQQECLDDMERYERHTMLEDIAEEAEEAISEES